MISKTKLKELAGYKQQKRCSEEGVFVVEGVKMCAEVLAAKCPVKYICATNSWLAQHPDLPTEAEVHEVDREALERLSGLKTPNEVWMLLPRQANSQFSILNSQFTLVLDRLQDPGNLGTIIRTADWFGVRHIVCSPDTVSCYNPKVVQSSMGSLLRTRIDYCPLPEWLATCGMPVYGALLDGDDLWGGTVPLPSAEGAVLAIGNEAAGISPEVQQHVTHRVKIPNIGGTAESLNAAVACAILTAELLRGKVCQSK
jgi:TrmH family RNA methyltransferase